jgi:hypothetical protein
MLGAGAAPVSAIEDSTLASMLASKAKNDVLSTSSTPGIGVHGDTKTRANRGSAIATINQQVGCGGLAIGNVRPVLGDHRQHQVTVVITGNVINSGNDC